MLQHHDKVIALVIQHMLLVVVAESIAVLVGITTGILVTRPRFKKLAFYVTNTANIGQSVPTLSVIGLTLPILGIGFIPAIFALFIYIVLPIIRNTHAGIVSVDKKIMEASVAIGLTRLQLIRYIEIPLSSKIILAGIRTSTIFCIGTASLVFLIGGGGLGELIFTGIQLVDPEMIIAGAVPAALLALAADLCFAVIGRLVQTHKSTISTSKR
ncbi:MAG: ABC transporter permease [Rhabdochlamydiaceae bacterium]